MGFLLAEQKGLELAEEPCKLVVLAEAGESQEKWLQSRVGLEL